MTSESEFSELKISTTTVTSSVPVPINIIDVAKYLPIDEIIIGIKVVYAGGNSSIIRDVAKMSKKAKDFYNQVTFTIRLPFGDTEGFCGETPSRLVSCKIFHNGTLHITGTNCLEEATKASNLLLERLKKLNDRKMISIRNDVPYLLAHDHLLYNSTGRNIGWINLINKEASTKDSQTKIYLKTEYVVLEQLDVQNEIHDTTDPFYVFVSAKCADNRRKIYTLDGDEIGTKCLQFKLNAPRRHYDVKFGHIYCGNKIIGNETIQWNTDCLSKLQSSKRYIDYLKEKGILLHHVSAFPQNSQMPVHFENEDFNVHMINMFFKAPFHICRKRLHKAFVDEDYHSRFDPCSHAAVNLRFHYNNLTMSQPENVGKCVKIFDRPCNCKDISVSCFNSGKMNITGLATVEQGFLVYDFLKEFFTKHRPTIQAFPE